MKKNKKTFIISLIALIILVVCLIAIYRIIPAGGKNRELLVAIGGQEIKVETATTEAEKYLGLSGRDSLCQDCGMLFVFPDQAEREFVMRDMKFPLDIIFINQGKIIKIATNLSPSGDSPLISYGSGQPADQVLEVNAGVAALNNWKEGDEVIVGRKIK